MPGANYMGGKRNAARARLKDFSGRLQKGHFGKQRLEVLAKGLGSAKRQNSEGRGGLADIALAHARKDIASRLTKDDASELSHHIYTKSPFTPQSKHSGCYRSSSREPLASSSSSKTRTSKVLAALDMSEPMSFQAQRDRILAMPDLAGLSGSNDEFTDTPQDFLFGSSKRRHDWDSISPSNERTKRRKLSEDYHDPGSPPLLQAVGRSTPSYDENDVPGSPYGTSSSVSLGAVARGSRYLDASSWHHASQDHREMMDEDITGVSSSKGDDESSEGSFPVDEETVYEDDIDSEHFQGEAYSFEDSDFSEVHSNLLDQNSNIPPMDDYDSELSFRVSKEHSKQSSDHSADLSKLSFATPPPSKFDSGSLSSSIHASNSSSSRPRSLRSAFAFPHASISGGYKSDPTLYSPMQEVSTTHPQGVFGVLHCQPSSVTLGTSPSSPSRHDSSKRSLARVTNIQPDAPSVIFSPTHSYNCSRFSSPLRSEAVISEPTESRHGAYPGINLLEEADPWQAVGNLLELRPPSASHEQASTLPPADLLQELQTAHDRRGPGFLQSEHRNTADVISDDENRTESLWMVRSGDGDLEPSHCRMDDWETMLNYDTTQSTEDPGSQKEEQLRVDSDNSVRHGLSNRNTPEERLDPPSPHSALAATPSSLSIRLTPPKSQTSQTRTLHFSANTVPKVDDPRSSTIPDLDVFEGPCLFSDVSEEEDED